MSTPVTPIGILSIQDAIFNQLTASQAPGGRLASIVGIGEDWLNEAEVYPAIYVGFDSFTQSEWATRKRKQILNYVVGLAYKSTVSMSDAKRQLMTLLDDGAGNGLLAVLNDPAFFSVNQLAEKGEVTECKTFDNLGMDKSASPSVFIAYAVCRFTVTTFSTATGTVQ